MAARRCVRCQRAWPDTRRYARCPVCNVATANAYQARPLDSRELEEIRWLLDEAPAELDAAELEAARRGHGWTVVDVLLEIPQEIT
jgi:hypothetical protein